MSKQEPDAPPPGEGWMPNVGVRPATSEECVDVVLRNGDKLLLTTAWTRWSFASPEEKFMDDLDIIWWRPFAGYYCGGEEHD